ncbi:MAG TPA: hypothetical protein VNQ90_15855 [Chthoniobacteraceae bacterium]|nr:hypothetical protein [Chthoniobacteraceae bacterium]
MNHLSISRIGTPLVTALAVLFLLPIAASASVLMLDFGPTTVAPADQTNSPYHTVNTSFSDTAWNKIEITNPASLVYSDGSAATGVTLTLGSSPNSTVVDFSSLPTHSNALGTQIGTGVFAGTSVGRDGIYRGNVGSQNNQVALKIGGVTAGTYEIYVVGLNTNTRISDQSPMNFYAAATGDVSTFDTGGLTPDATTLITANTPWMEGGSYGKITVDLAAGQYLVLVSDGAGSESRGFLNSVQIVAIPEPSTVILGLAGCFSLIALRRVSRRRAA